MLQSILVTGGAGNIGSALTRAMVKLPQTQVIVADNFSTGSLAKVRIDAGDGSQTRTFCYVDDTVDTCVAVHRTGAYENDVINIGSDVEISIRQLAETVIEVVGSASKLTFLPALQEGDMTRRCPETSKMRSLLNRPIVPLEEGILRLAEYLSAATGVATLQRPRLGIARGARR